MLYIPGLRQKRWHIALETDQDIYVLHGKKDPFIGSESERDQYVNAAIEMGHKRFSEKGEVLKTAHVQEIPTQIYQR